MGQDPETFDSLGFRKISDLIHLYVVVNTSSCYGQRDVHFDTTLTTSSEDPPIALSIRLATNMVKPKSSYRLSKRVVWRCIRNEEVAIATGAVVYPNRIHHLEKSGSAPRFE